MLNVTIYCQIQLIIEKGIGDLILETVGTKLGNCRIRTSEWYGKSLSGIGRAKVRQRHSLKSYNGVGRHRRYFSILIIKCIHSRNFRSHVTTFISDGAFAF